jgi:hypothetical protein
MRFEVPQFIEIEDKIFGPLTWRQFLYLGGGVGMAVVLFLRLPFIGFIAIGIPLGVLAGALAFYPVNNRPFSYFLESIVNYFSGKRLYLWRNLRTSSQIPKHPHQNFLNHMCGLRRQGIYPLSLEDSNYKLLRKKHDPFTRC